MVSDNGTRALNNTICDEDALTTITYFVLYECFSAFAHPTQKQPTVVFLSLTNLSVVRVCDNQVCII